MDSATVTSLTSAVDFSAIITGIGTVAVAAIGLRLAVKAVGVIKGMVSRA